jgi:hypothetical protein
MTMSENEMDRETEFERREEEEAAAEARAIGGPAPEYEGDEEVRAVEEGGGGVAEGFEEAERDLVEAAGHGEHRHNPSEDEFPPEARSDEATAVYGEPDEVDPTEVVSDPEAGAEDPGEGPGLAADR